jgi:hypothetical protein
MTEGPTPPRLRIRWGWFLGCILLGLAGILLGLLIAPLPDKAAYLASVLGGVGTTLLLIGIVVLLERRIVDTAVRVVRDANEEARRRTNEEVRAQARDLEARVAALWDGAEAEDTERLKAETQRLTDEFSRRVVDGYDDPPTSGAG